MAIERIRSSKCIPGGSMEISLEWEEISAPLRVYLNDPLDKYAPSGTHVGRDENGEIKGFRCISPTTKLGRGYKGHNIGGKELSVLNNKTATRNRIGLKEDIRLSAGVKFFYLRL